MQYETKEYLDKFKNDVATMKGLIPETVTGFVGLFTKGKRSGSLSKSA